MALSCLMSSVPQFVGDRYKVDLSPHPQNLKEAAAGTGQTPGQGISFSADAAKHSAGSADSDVAHARNSGVALRKLLGNVASSTNKPHLEGDNSSKFASKSGQGHISDFINFSTTTLSYPLINFASPPVNSTKSLSIPQSGDTNCDAEPQSSSGSLLFLYIAVGSILKGMGHSPVHPLGMSFIDDFALETNSALYVGKRLQT